MWPVNDLLTLFRLTWIELPAFGIIDVSFMETRYRIAIIPLFSIHYTDYNLLKLKCHTVPELPMIAPLKTSVLRTVYGGPEYHAVIYTVRNGSREKRSLV